MALITIVSQSPRISLEYRIGGDLDGEATRQLDPQTRALILTGVDGMTKQEAIARLKQLNKDGRLTEDVEQAHMDADLVLCELLRSMDCCEVADEFVKVEKWYS